MPITDLRARAASTHVVVIGAGIAGLVAARECAKLGIRVTVLEAAEHPGGTIRRAALGDLVIDTGAECFSTRNPAVRELLEEVGLGERIAVPARSDAWVSGIPGVGAAPLPGEHIAGIPLSPFDERVRRIIGWRGAWRAYLDRVRPHLTIGHATSLGRLVAARMGPLVRDRLMAPRSIGVWGAHPDDLDTDAVAPGLNAALTRAGSLSGAVTSLRAAAAPATATLRGGLSLLIDALVADLVALGGQVRTGMPVQALARQKGGWRVIVAVGEHERDEIDADAVVVATDEARGC